MEYSQLFAAFKEKRKEDAELQLSHWIRNKGDLRLHITTAIQQKSVLHYSCYNGWRILSIRLIEEFKLDPSFEDDQGNTSLHMACKSGNNELVSHLIKCNPFRANRNGDTALDTAIMAKNSTLVKYLIKKCGCGQLCKTMGEKIMNLLFQFWDKKVAKCLICDGGCQLTMQNGTTLLHEFASKGNLAAVLFLIAKCDCKHLQVINDNGHTVLDCAIMAKNSTLVSFLVDKCRCNQLSKAMGKKIMKLLYEFWDEEVAKCLICNRGCQLTMENGTTLLHEFASKLRFELVSYLIAECHCKPLQVTNNKGYTVLDCAIMAKNSMLVSFLVNKCGCNQLSKAMGKTIMKLLYEFWDEEVAKCLIRDGSCLLVMENGTTLLHEFASKGHLAAVLLLIADCHCKPLQVTNDKGHTVLDCAIMAKNSTLVSFLVDKCGCNQLSKAMGKKIMKLLYEFWDEEVVKCLICNGGCQLTMENGTSLLHEFASKLRFELVSFLIAECHCKPLQVTNDKGHTVLDCAIMAKNGTLVSHLVNKCGCNQLSKAMGRKIMKLLHEFWDKEVAKCLICDGGCQLTMKNGTTLLHEFASKLRFELV